MLCAIQKRALRHPAKGTRRSIEVADSWLGGSDAQHEDLNQAPTEI
jgi:hypothetical protein